jgi:hypothetical protein
MDEKTVLAEKPVLAEKTETVLAAEKTVSTTVSAEKHETFTPVCKDVTDILALYKLLVKRVEHNVEEMESILKVYRDLEATTKGVAETQKLTVSKSVFVNFLVAYKILVKRAKFEIEELEVFGKPFRVLNEMPLQ